MSTGLIVGLAVGIPVGLFALYKLGTSMSASSMTVKNDGSTEQYASDDYERRKSEVFGGKKRTGKKVQKKGTKKR